MSQRLKNKDSPVSLAFTPPSVATLLAQINGDAFPDGFCQLITCARNGRDQLSLFKQLHKELLNSDWLTDSRCLRLLCGMFVQCLSKHPLRRSLVSLLQSLNYEQKEMLIEAMSSCLEHILQLNELVEEITLMRHNVDLIAALMENFPTGNEVIEKNDIMVLSYLQQIAACFLTLYRNNSCSVTQTNLLHHLHATLKTIVFSLNKSRIVDDDLHSNALHGILSVVCDIMTDENVFLEVRCTSAMVFVSVLNRLPINSLTMCVSFVLQVLRYGFQGQNNLPKNNSFICDSLEIVSLHLHKSPVRLILLNALLVKLPPSIAENHLSYKTLIKELICLSKDTSTKPILVLAFKSISFWVEVAMNSSSYSDVIYESVLPHLLCHLDHHIDTVRHTIFIAIKNCLSCLSARQNFILFCVKNSLSSDLKSRGKIAFLSALVDFVPVALLLDLRPSLPKDVLDLLSNVDLSKHACDLYHTLSEKHFKESNSKQEWLHLWTSNPYELLLSQHKDTKSYIVDYVIPNLLAVCPGILEDLLRDLNVYNFRVRSAVVVLKCARSMKNTSKETFAFLFHSNESCGKWRGFINMGHMKKCLEHIDVQIRLDSLSLICHTSKTCEPLVDDDIVLLKHFLRRNMAVEDASFRQYVVTNFKKLLFRMLGSTYKPLGNDDKLLAYSQFIIWFVKFLFGKIYLVAAYCQLSLALQLLSLLTVIFKNNANAVLIDHLHFTDEEKLEFTEIMIECFNDSYDPNRTLVLEILSGEPVFLKSVCSLRAESLACKAFANLRCSQPDVSAVGGYLICYLSFALNAETCTNVLESMHHDQCFFSQSNATTAHVAGVLFNEVRDQLKVMKSSIVEGSQCAPLYGALHALRLVFSFHNLNSNHCLVVDYSAEFSKFLEDLISICLEIVELLSAYITSASPEGYLCGVSLVQVFEQLNLNHIDNIETQAQIARMLLVCSWRCVKEVSLLLGYLVSNFSQRQKNTDCVLTKDSVLKIWQMFCSVLLQSKHAGAYELATLGFLKLCTVLWTHDDVDLKIIPKTAISAFINGLESSDAAVNASHVTRRSAGVPFYLEAICTTEPAIKGKETFKHLMRCLITFCSSENGDINNFVVAVNILRAFYKNTKLAEDVFPYISDGVVISMNGFCSPHWASRNSCTLLFSSLMQRIFGVKKYQMTGREFFTRFPTLYPFLLDRAKAITFESLKTPSSLNASVFPLLLFLSHLYPSTLDGADSLMKLEAFISHVMKCAQSPVYKTRTMAASSLVPLISLEKSAETVEDLVRKVRKLCPYEKEQHYFMQLKVIDENHLHGCLLQIEKLLQRIADNDFTEKTISKLLWIFDTCVSFLSKTVLLDVILERGEGVVEFATEMITGEALEDVCVSLQNNISHIITNKPNSPGSHVFLNKALCFIAMRNVYSKETERLVTTLLGSSSYDLQFCAVHFLRLSKRICERLQTLLLGIEVNKRIYPEVLSLLIDHPSLALSTEQYIKLWYSAREDRRLNVSEEGRMSLLKLALVLLDHTNQLTVNEQNLSLYKQLWEHVFDCSKAKENEVCRLEVAKMLTMQMQENHFNSINNECIYVFFHTCINLLRDSQNDIRVAAARSLVNTNKEDGFYVPQATVVMETIEGQILEQMRRDPLACFRFLMGFVLEQSSDDGGCASSPPECLKRFIVFEEGKLNPYFDEYDLRERCIGVLNNYLQGTSGVKTTDFQTVLTEYKNAQSYERVLKMLETSKYGLAENEQATP